MGDMPLEFFPIAVPSLSFKARLSAIKAIVLETRHIITRKVFHIASF